MTSQKRSGDLCLPVGVSDQRQAAVVPRNLPKNGKDKEQHLKTKEEEERSKVTVLENWTVSLTIL